LITSKRPELVAVLQCAGLNRLSSSLDRVARCDRELTDDEQQCLVFTRILLHKPRWVVIDEVLEALEDDARRRVISLFKDGLKDAAIINIGRPEAKNHFSTRVLHLIKDPHGRRFIPDLSVAFAGQPMAASAVGPVNPIG
jgi:vitamin B12/bleomycin/antimicrobial peptide transport system ATP-binding/permease protein